jgi:hypothetical protein
LRARVRAECSLELEHLFHAAASDWSAYSPVPIADGRGGSVIVSPAANVPPLLVRRYLRGGLPAFFVRDLYIGWQPRPFRELRITQSLYEHGAAVAEPYGAAVQWLFPGCYRGWLATRFIEGARTLWRWLRDESPSSSERHEVLGELARTVHHIRSLGVQHADLNLHNILVCPPSNRIVLIDFDRAAEGVAVAGDLSVELVRLRRSARKLDPEGRVIREEDLAILTLRP